jgi:hypothetical protein
VEIQYVIEVDETQEDGRRKRESTAHARLSTNEYGVLFETAGGGTRVLTPWHRVLEVWYK